MAVVSQYLSWRIRHSTLPAIRAYGQWVNDYIIPVVNDLTARADAIERETYDRLSAAINPERYTGDGWELAEQAFDMGLSFYETWSSMYQAALNLFTAGLFHSLEQRLADLTHDGAIENPVPDSQLSTVVDWYREHFEADLTTFASWNAINELRLVANAIKHGEGRSTDELRPLRPDLFQSPHLRNDPRFPVVHWPIHLPLGGDGLYVTADDFKKYDGPSMESLISW